MKYVNEFKDANAIGGKTARACDSCLRRRARWFCVADDAFLCQACDASVHSANQLASRHERVRLETSSFKGNEVVNTCPAPAWHQGFTRKARTPRHTMSKRLQQQPNNPLPLVPEINGEDPFAEENEEQLLCRVPVFDPFLDEFCATETWNGSEEADYDHCDLNLAELLNCDVELEEFAANVESLLGDGVEEDSAGGNNDLDSKTVKVEEEVDDDEETQAVMACHFDPALDVEMNRDFDYAPNSSMAGEDGEESKNELASIVTAEDNMESETQVKKMMLLSLNYEAVMADWATQGSPWTTRVRPDELNLDEIMMMTSLDGDFNGGRWGSASEIAEREARVSRYREKRRTRLFSKKIRYQVRKINAEKRPRMKGRFVKRTSFLGSSFPTPPYLMNK